MLAAALAMSLRDVAAGVSSYASLSSPVNTLPSSQTCPADLLSTVCDVVTFVSPTRDDPWPEATDRAIILYLNGIDNQARVTGTLSSSFPSMAANPSTIDIANLQMAYTALQTVSFTSVIDRLRALQVFNSKFTAVLPFLDLSTNPHSLLTEAQLSRARVCVLLAQKDELLRRCLVATQAPDYRPSVTLNRFAAIKHPNRNMFRQLMRQLETVVSPTGDGFIAAFRSGHSGNRPWHVRSFVGEHGLDLGGLFNSSLTEAIEAAMSPLSYSPVPLFIPTPNNRAGSGSDRDKLTFHPEATTPAHSAMFKFLGQLIGVTIRLSFPVDVRLSRLFWKAVVGDVPTLSDLESVDSVFVEQMRRLSVPSPDPVLLQHLHMCVVMSDGSVKDLVTGGSSVPVTLATVPLYVQLATRARLEVCELRLFFYV